MSWLIINLNVRIMLDATMNGSNPIHLEKIVGQNSIYDHVNKCRLFDLILCQRQIFQVYTCKCALKL